jgi:hypothetical protein
MNIKNYLSDLNDQTQVIFHKSVEYHDELGKAHHFASCIYEFAQNISDKDEREMLTTVSSQIETATLNVSLGMYRQAFSSLRLAFEMALAVVHFSVHKLELQEWLDGRADIKWAALIHEDNGILSDRFAKAFFTEFSQDVGAYRSKARNIYRNLSEYVHGNNETWSGSGLELKFNEGLLISYFKSINIVEDIIVFVLSCRYLKTFSAESLESLEFIPENMNHISYIREYFGGPSN